MEKMIKKNITGRTNGLGLFYLHISKSLCTDDLFKRGFAYLSEKDMYGKTGMQVFEEYLKENVWKS
jgi:hypothetical protein